LGGNITDDNGLNILERGVVYSESSKNNHPEIGGPGVTKEDNGNDIGLFSERIGTLLPGTTYCFRAYATNAAGTSYGEIERFTTFTLPVAVCKNITANLDENGLVTIYPTNIDNGSSAEAGIYTMSLDNQHFDCGRIGDNFVTLTVKDNDGNIAQCNSTVTIEDRMTPTFTPVNDIVIQLESGVCETQINYPEMNVTDNCSSVTPKLVSGLGPDGIFPVGTTTEVWSASDNSGNTDYVSFNVIVTATNAPPTIDSLVDIFIKKDASKLAIPLTGISGGADCKPQEVTISATANNTELVSSALVNYNDGSTGELTLTIVSGVNGTSEVTVIVEDSEGVITERTFVLTIDTVNDPPFVVNPIADQVVNASYGLKVPVSSTMGVLFDDSDDNSLVINVMEAGTDTLPDWAIYEADTLFCTPMIADTGCVNFVVQATDLEGATAMDTFSICVEGYPTIINEFGNDVFDVLMYPNPTKGEVNLDINSGELNKVELSVMDVTGNLVFRQKYSTMQTIRFDMSGKVSGMYFVHLDINGRHIIKKLIVNRNE